MNLSDKNQSLRKIAEKEILYNVNKGKIIRYSLGEFKIIAFNAEEN